MAYRWTSDQEKQLLVIESVLGVSALENGKEIRGTVGGSMPGSAATEA